MSKALFESLCVEGLLCTKGVGELPGDFARRAIREGKGVSLYVAKFTLMSIVERTVTQM